MINVLLIALAALMVASGFTIKSSAKELPNGCYYTDDAFKYVPSKKGVQGYDDAEVKEVYNVFMNVFMETAFVDDATMKKVREQGYIPADYERWVYGGKVYYFKDPEGLWYEKIQELNSKNITVTAQLLLRYDSKRQRLMEPSARGNQGANYYAPNVSESSVVEEYIAFMDFMTYRYGSIFCHIDAYVVGNEVNAPGTWNYFGSECMNGAGLFGTFKDQNKAIDKYVSFYNIVYDSVKKHNKGTRVCACVDHSWNEAAGGTRIPVKSFLNSFNSKVNGREWNLAYHCYPSGFDNPKIWASSTNPKNENAQYVDGYNLEVLTGYVKKNFGANHRILLTEQGFSRSYGEDAQAASLTYTYYKAKFDDMVDAMHVMKFEAVNGHVGSGYELYNKGKQIWAKLDSGSDADEEWILNQVKGTIGISSFASITPNWKKESELQKARNEFKAEYKYYWSGIDLSPVYDFDYFTKTSYPRVLTFYVKDARYEENIFGYFCQYGMKEGYKGNATFNVFTYQNEHVSEIPSDLSYTQQRIYAHVLYSRKMTQPDEASVEKFCKRLYSDCLERQPDPTGINYWKNKILNGECTGSDAAANFVFSEEYDKKGVTKTEYIKMLYRVFMGREADENGLAFWKQKMREGWSREQVFASFVGSEEYAGICKSYRIKPGKYKITGRKDPVATSGTVTKPMKDYVERIYDKALGRGSDPEGIDYWTKQIANEEWDPTAVAEYFIISKEFESKNLNNTEYVKVLYRTFMGRESDEVGLNFWLGEMQRGESRQKILKRFAGCAEFQEIVKSFGL